MRPKLICMLAATAMLPVAPKACAQIQADMTPYTATVSVDEAQLRSGPGTDYYATDVLPANSPVEVYREAPGGWLAVRPPESSYSWVFSRHVKIIREGVGQINKNDVASRIGGLENEKREVIQVRLHDGERVAIIDNSENGLWCKIRPPSGEFRWIHADNVQLANETAGPSGAADGSSGPPPDDKSAAAPAPDQREPAALSRPTEETTPLDGPMSDDGSSAQAAPKSAAAPKASDRWSTHAPASTATEAEPAADQTGSVVPPAEPTPKPQQVADVSAVPLNDSGWVSTTAHQEPVRRKHSRQSDTRSPEAAPANEAWATSPHQIEHLLPPRRVAEDPRFKPPSPPHQRHTTQQTGQQPPNAPPTNPSATPNEPQAESGRPSQIENREIAADFARKLTELDLRLSQTVTADRQQWHLESLERDAEALLTKAQTVAEREAIQQTIARIDRFAGIQRQFDQVATAPPPTPQPAAPAPYANHPYVAGQLQSPGYPPPGSTISAPPVPSSTVSPFAYRPIRQPSRPLIRNRSQRYDAEGILQPVRSQQAGVPRFALVDQAGRIKRFITPTPDVDVEPFLGQHVGVVGREDYMPSLQQSHITAGRISPLGNRMLR